MFKILGTDGKEYGPVTRGNVIEWIRDGRANLQTKAKRSDETEWKTLGDFPEFVPTGNTPPSFPRLWWPRRKGSRYSRRCRRQTCLRRVYPGAWRPHLLMARSNGFAGSLQVMPL